MVLDAESTHTNMFVYKWKVSDIIKGTALVKQIGNCTVTDDEGKLWLVKVLSQSLFTRDNYFKAQLVILKCTSECSI